VEILKQGKTGYAEPLLKRALAIFEKTLGPDHPDVAACLCKMTKLNSAIDEFAEAESCCKRAMAIYEKHGERETPGMAKALEDYATLLKKTGRAAEAKKAEARAKEIRANASQ
jgi:tetratricopeptide (TPR) repeat protein